MPPSKRIKKEPGTENPEPVPDQKPGEFILIEDDEENKEGKQRHYQAFMRHLVIFVNFKF